MRRAVLTLTAVLAVVPADALAQTADAPDGRQPAGLVRFVKRADAAFDRQTSSPTPQFQAEMRASYWRATVFSPYWEQRSSWYPNGWIYRDLYAIYRGSQLEKDHPEWRLRDAQGHPLWIPFGCDGSTCPQWAGDFTNRDFRRNWIANARAELSGGRFRGLWLDDVNLDFRSSDAHENFVAPIDPRTGRTMTEQAWREAIADFVTEVRAALPDVEIVHNAVWYAGGPSAGRNPAVRRAAKAADFIHLERGVNDAGLTGGTGPFGLRTFLDYVDRLHREGHGVVLDAKSGRRERNYAVAAFLLISTGRDALSAAARTSVNAELSRGAGLGAAKGRRRSWRGLLRRDFARGVVLVNEPSAHSQSVRLQGRWTTADGTSVRKVTLKAASGVVLRR